MSIELEKSGLNRFDKVTKIANMNPIFCNELQTIFTVIEEILNTGARRIPITTRKKEVVGIVTIADILDAFLRKEDFNKPISTIMSRDVIFCDVENTILFLLQKFKLS
ncbi:MAG: CBS domain-containing protein, partial [Candidatus Omnitrophica bacterium]|nr:CBS domain-containing protein [Candidatus Omnitrophota bacterium]